MFVRIRRLSVLHRVSKTFANIAWQGAYKALLRVSRQWRNLKARKWNGIGHKDHQVEQGELAVECPACPYPGVNLPEDWESDPDK